MNCQALSFQRLECCAEREPHARSHSLESVAVPPPWTRELLCEGYVVGVQKENDKVEWNAVLLPAATGSGPPPWSVPDGQALCFTQRLNSSTLVHPVHFVDYDVIVCLSLSPTVHSCTTADADAGRQTAGRVQSGSAGRTHRLETSVDGNSRCRVTSF